MTDPTTTGDGSTAGRRPRILLVESTPACDGGAQMMLDELLHRADRSRVDVSFACLADGPWAAAVRAEGIPVHVLPQTRWRDVGNVRAVAVGLRDVIRAEGIDLVHASGSSTLLCASLAARWAKVPLVWLIFDPLRGSSPRRLLTARRRVSAALLGLLHPDWVIFGTGRAAEAGPPRRRTPTTTVLPGIEVDRHRGGDGARAREALGLDAEAPVVATFGRLTFLKSQVEFVRMMAEVARSHPGVRGVVCGSESDRAYAERVRQVRTEAGMDDVVALTGFVPDQLKDDLLAAADVVVHLAKRESFGLAVVEAMAAGRPVVAVAASGPRSLIDDRVTGRLVPIDDVGAAAKAVGQLLDDPEAARAMGAAAAGAAEAYSVEEMVAKIEAVWDAVLAQAGSRRR